MRKRFLHVIRTHPKWTVFAAVVVAFTVLNALAFSHAYSMTHFVEHGHRTSRPEEMSFFEKAKVVVGGVRIPKPRSEATPDHVGLAFEAHRFEGPEGVEYEAWFVPATKSGPLVVLFHGYSESKSRLLGEAAAFHDLGCSALLVDFRACGGSSGFETTIGYREADDVAATIRFAQDRLTDELPVLYGRSMGSAAILPLHVLRVEARGVVLESPFDRLLSTVKNRFMAMGIPPFPCSELLVFWGGVQQGYSGFSHNPVEYASAVVCPALVLRGERDCRATPEQVQRVYQGLAGEKRLVTFENAGHESCLKTDPLRWKQEVGGFLREVMR